MSESVTTTAEIFERVTHNIPTTTEYNPTHVSARKQRRKTRANAELRTGRDAGINDIPCVRHYLDLINKSESIGFAGRVKVVTEMRDAGKTEDEIAQVFLQSPAFEGKYLDDIVLPDHRPEIERNPSGYRLRSDIWNEYEALCNPVPEELCDPFHCYRLNSDYETFDTESPSFDEFRDQSREAVKEALTQAQASNKNIVVVQASMASGKTYQLARLAVDKANEGEKVLITADDHETCKTIIEEIRKYEQQS